jgi:hypothetical protein
VAIPAMNNPISDSTPRWRQCLLKLTHTVIFDDRRRLVCIPDRMSATNERDKLKRQHGAVMITANISKNGKGKSATYTLAYTLRELRVENLF